MKNFHLPLPEETYAALQDAADRSGIPATVLGREAIDQWLLQQKMRSRHEAILAYANEVTGTPLDLDPDLEQAGIEHFTKAMDMD